MNVRELTIKLLLNRSDLKPGLDDTKKGLKETGAAGRRAGEEIRRGAEEAGGGMKGLIGILGKGLALLGGVALIKSSLSGYIATAAAIDQTATALGLSAERLQQWQGAAETAGGTAEEMVARFQDMTGNIVDAVKFGSGPLKEVADTLKIGLTDASGAARSAEDVFLDLADAMAGMDGGAAAGFGKKLGFDAGTISLLQRGRTALDELLRKQKELGILTQADVETARKAREALGFMNRAWGAVGNMAVKILVPALTWLADKLTVVATWVRRNEGFITAFLYTLAGIITAVMLPALVKMAAAMIAAFWPVILIGAAVAGVATLIGLLIDDFMSWSEGGQSLFGDLWQSAVDAFRVIQGAVAALWAYIEPIWTAFKTLWAGVWTAIRGIFKGDAAAIETGLGQMLDGALGMFKGWAGAIMALLTALFDWIVALFAQLGGLIGRQIDAAIAGVKDSAANAWSDVKGFFGFGDEGRSPVAPSAASAPSVSNRTQTNTVTAETRIGEINIQTQATDARGIARDLGQELRAEPLQADYAMGY